MRCVYAMSMQKNPQTNKTPGLLNICPEEIIMNILTIAQSTGLHVLSALHSQQSILELLCYRFAESF